MRVGPTLVNREPRGTSRVCCLDYIIIIIVTLYLYGKPSRKKKRSQ